MHLFYQNIALRMRDHWAGQYLLGNNSDDHTGNAYIISQSMWKDIERDMGRIVYPTAFGDRPRSPLAFRKAAEWKAWVKVISSVVLQGRLPEPYYSEWINLVKAISLATDYSIRTDDIPRLRIMMARFITHYEDLYYQHKLARLPVTPLKIGKHDETLE